MPGIRININDAAVARMLNGPSGPVAWNLEQRGKRVGRRARQLAPGSMKRKIKVNMESGHVRIECTHPATLYVIKGTRPHMIRPSTKKALKFKIGGRTVFARVVNHPGNKPNNFLLAALREGSGR
jgi:hypothetical protein